MGGIIRYHPTIPFKHPRKIVKQIAWAVKEEFREGRYCLANRNCEHLVSMLVYGVNYSKQVNERQLGSSFCTSCFVCCDMCRRVCHVASFHASPGVAVQMGRQLARGQCAQTAAGGCRHREGAGPCVPS